MEKYTFYRRLFLVSILTFVNYLSAQQDPQYTQYMYNMSVLNPAYAKEDGSLLSMGGLYRTQWVGAVGAPTTGTFFAHMPLSQKVQIGTSIVNDKIGNIVNETNAFVDFAYILDFNSSKLSLGLKAGASFYDTDFNGFQLIDALPDQAFAENISKVFPNVGVGMFYYTDKYYFGLSAPNLLRSKHLAENNGIYIIGVEEVHYFATGGYVFDLNDNLKFKPAFMVKSVSGTPLSFDITGNVLINDRFEIGAAYRWDDAISGLVNFKITKSLRLGYAYDYTLSNLGKYNSGSHEVMVLFDLYKGNKKNKIFGYDKSPRFF